MSEKNESRALSVKNEGDSPQRSLRSIFADPGNCPAYVSNIPADDPDGDRLYMATLGEADFDADDLFGSTFLLSRYIAQRSEWKNDNGDGVRVGLRVTLIDIDGNTVSFGSDGIVRSLEMLIARRGPGPWNPPIPVRLKQIGLMGGRRYFVLQIASPENAAF